MTDDELKPQKLTMSEREWGEVGIEGRATEWISQTLAALRHEAFTRVMHGDAPTGLAQELSAHAEAVHALAAIEELPFDMAQRLFRAYCEARPFGWRECYRIITRTHPTDWIALVAGDSEVRAWRDQQDGIVEGRVVRRALNAPESAQEE